MLFPCGKDVRCVDVRRNVQQVCEGGKVLHGKAKSCRRNMNPEYGNRRENPIVCVREYSVEEM